MKLKCIFKRCPKRKETRINLTDAEWAARDWTEEQININCALPKHMWNWQQDDRVWPMCHEFRGENAYGPRAKGLVVKGKTYDIMKKFIPTPPKLVKGRGISRWMTVKDTSVIEIPLFDDYEKTWTPENIPEELEVIERNPGHPDYTKKKQMAKAQLLKDYAPTALQKFSDKSKLLRDPWHFSYHSMIQRREVI